MKKSIDLSSLPKGGPYSHANIAGEFVFVSGQTGQIEGKETTFTQQFENAMFLSRGYLLISIPA